MKFRLYTQHIEYAVQSTPICIQAIDFSSPKLKCLEENKKDNQKK